MLINRVPLKYLKTIDQNEVEENLAPKVIELRLFGGMSIMTVLET